MRLIRQNAYRRQPWKNGGGETIEIAIHPPGATTADFDWRVSMAKVETDGPFSAFDGVDRTLAILDGRGIELSVEGDAPARITDRPHSFPGDRPTAAALLDGAITDLNVMTRRGRHAHRVTPLMLTGTRDIVVMSPIAMLYCHRGSVRVEEEFVASFVVAAGETLLIEGMPNGVSMSAIDAATLYLIEIGPAPKATG